MRETVAKASADVTAGAVDQMDEVPEPQPVMAELSETAPLKRDASHPRNVDVVHRPEVRPCRR
jgi:hypothetical protein